MEVRVVFVGQMCAVWKREKRQQPRNFGIDERRGEDVWRVRELDDGSHLAQVQVESKSGERQNESAKRGLPTYEMVKVDQQDSDDRPVQIKAPEPRRTLDRLCEVSSGVGCRRTTRYVLLRLIVPQREVV